MKNSIEHLEDLEIALSSADILGDLRTRMPWSVANRMLRREGLPRGQGWQRTIERAEGGDDFAQSENDLTDALEEHLVAGEKLVRLYNLDDGAAEALRDEVENLQIADNPLSNAFPQLLNEVQLEELAGAVPIPIAKVEYVHGTALVFGSTCYLTTREHLEGDEIPEAVTDELGEFNEIIGIRVTRHEACDVLWVPAEGGLVELRVDYPFGTPLERGQAALDNAEEQLGELFETEVSDEQLNLYPLIQHLYDAEGEGVMVELGFMVSGAAQKLERMRRTGLCCRTEAYHLGGKGALQVPIQPYRTSVMWPYAVTDEVNNYPEITLRGKSINTGQANPFLGEMTVRNCIGLDDYDHVIGRVASLL